MTSESNPSSLPALGHGKLVRKWRKSDGETQNPRDFLKSVRALLFYNQLIAIGAYLSFEEREGTDKEGRKFSHFSLDTNISIRSSERASCNISYETTGTPEKCVLQFRDFIDGLFSAPQNAGLYICVGDGVENPRKYIYNRGMIQKDEGVRGLPPAPGVGDGS